MDKYFDLLTNILDQLGFYGPFLIILLCSVSLWGQNKFLFLYLIFSFVNIYFNRGLKMIFQEPRPKGFADEKNVTKDLEFYKNGDQYGMPSGHSNLSFYSIAYSYLVKKQINSYFLMEMTLALVTLAQRFKYKKHTLTQLFVGAIVGMIYAYVAFEISKIIIKNYDE